MMELNRRELAGSGSIVYGLKLERQRVMWRCSRTRYFRVLETKLWQWQRSFTSRKEGEKEWESYNENERRKFNRTGRKEINEKFVCLCVWGEGVKERRGAEGGSPLNLGQPLQGMSTPGLRDSPPPRHRSGSMLCHGPTAEVEPKYSHREGEMLLEAAVYQHSRRVNEVWWKSRFVSYFEIVFIYPSFNNTGRLTLL